MASAGPWMRPYILGTPILAAKSSISSLSRKPERAGGNVRAKAVIERGGDGDGVAFAVDHGVVRGVVRFGARRPAVAGAGGRKPCGRTSAALGVADPATMPARHAAAYFFDVSSATGMLVVIRVAEILGAVHVGAAEGLRDQVHRCGGAVAEPGQIVSLPECSARSPARLRQTKAAARSGSCSCESCP